MENETRTNTIELFYTRFSKIMTVSKSKRKMIYQMLAEKCMEGDFMGFVSINEDYVRFAVNVAYSQTSVIPLAMLPEIYYLQPIWNYDHNICRGEDWFAQPKPSPLEKALLFDFCLAMVNDPPENF